MRNYWVAFVVVVSLWAHTGLVLGEPIHWVAADLPPFIWQEDGQPKGYANDIIEAMSKKLGRRADISFYPWARAVKMTSDGPSYGVFPLARTPDREANFRWLVPLARVRYIFLGRREAVAEGAGPDLKNLSSLRTHRIGVLRGSPIIRNLQASQFQKIIEAKSYKELLDLLLMDMLDAVYAGDVMIWASVDRSGHARSEFRSGTGLGEANLYLAASAQLDDEEFGHWTHAYDMILRDGTVKRLQKKYSIGRRP